MTTKQNTVAHLDSKHCITQSSETIRTIFEFSIEIHCRNGTLKRSRSYPWFKRDKYCDKHQRFEVNYLWALSDFYGYGLAGFTTGTSARFLIWDKRYGLRVEYGIRL